MPAQVDYYNHFGIVNRENILACPEPELWTTDWNVKGRVYREMKERIRQQLELITNHFNKQDTVLDIGCGFGRQAILLAKNGYAVSGTDTSNVFITLARDLFDKHHYKGNFFCTDIIGDKNITGNYKQILLLDVLEHIQPIRRKFLLRRLYEITMPGAVLIISVPRVKRRWSSQLNNTIRRGITQYLSNFLRKEEHPYPIPGRNKILQMTQGYFVLNTFTGSPETDYYVFHRS